MPLPNSTLSRSGILFVLSAPSGAGKSTLCSRLHREREEHRFIYSVSCTTRPPRPGEVHGHDYYFLSHEEFRSMIEAGEFLEYAEVHGNFYGTRRSTVLDSLREGHDVLIDIDTQGAEQIRKNTHPEIRSALADIFLLPPSMEELERRLTLRGTETPEEIALRLANAREELAHWQYYRYILIAETIDGVYHDFCAIMRAERRLTRRFQC